MTAGGGALASPRQAAFSSTGGDIAVSYDAVYGRASPAQGEHRLLLAVLEEGVRTMLKNAQATRGRAMALRNEALAWLLSDEHADVFAFESICEALGLDPGRLRRRILEAVDNEET
jgi:hypothetical protein